MTENTTTRPLFTVRTLALYFGCSERKVRDLVAGQTPEIASFLLGGQRRIEPAEVDRYVAALQDAPSTDEEGSDA